jgi:arylsulfatase
VGRSCGEPAKRGEYITYDLLANFDVRQSDYAIDYIKKQAKDSKPFFMDVNFMKMHNPTNASSKFAGNNAGRRVATAEARITDAKDRLLAHATTTCLVFEFPKGSAKD